MQPPGPPIPVLFPPRIYYAVVIILIFVPWRMARAFLALLFLAALGWFPQPQTVHQLVLWYAWPVVFVDLANEIWAAVASAGDAD